MKTTKTTKTTNLNSVPAFVPALRGTPGTKAGTLYDGKLKNVPAFPLFPLFETYIYLVRCAGALGCKIKPSSLTHHALQYQGICILQKKRERGNFGNKWQATRPAPGFSGCRQRVVCG